MTARRPLAAGLAAARHALAGPIPANAATFVAFGASCAGAGLGPVWMTAANLLIYGMPGQLILVQAMAGAPAGGAAIGATLSAGAANSRFLPMAVSLAPWLRGGAPAWRRWLAIPFIAVTPWAVAMQVLPGLPAPERLPWFVGFGLATWVSGALASFLGFYATSWFTGPLRDALLFANPLYFALLVTSAMVQPAARRAVLCGLATAPLALLLPASFGLLVVGVIGGSLAFAWGQLAARRAPAR